MKKKTQGTLSRASRDLRLRGEVVLHLTTDDLRRVQGGSSNTNCFGCNPTVDPQSGSGG